jgi:hypothetical protein
MRAAGWPRSRGDARSILRAFAGEATLCATEVEALRTSDAWDLLFALSLARARLRRELSLSAVCLRRDRRATRRCDTDCRSAGHAEDELEASAGGSALSGLGRGDACLQRDARRRSGERALTDAEVSASRHRRPSDATSNQSMKLTASKPAIYTLGVCHPRFWFHGSSHRARRSLSPSR